MAPVLLSCTLYCDGEPVESWGTPKPEVFCYPDDLRRYMETERWDLVFNALCHLSGAVDEGLA